MIHILIKNTSLNEMGKAHPIKGDISSLGEPPTLPKELFNNSTNFEAIRSKFKAMSGNELADLYVKHGFEEYIKKAVKANYKYNLSMTKSGMTKEQIEAFIDKTFSISLKTLRTGQPALSQITAQFGTAFSSMYNSKNTTPEQKEAFLYWTKINNLRANNITPVVNELLNILSASGIWGYVEQYFIYSVMTKISGKTGMRWNEPQLPDGNSTSETRKLPPIEGEEAILAGTGGLKRYEALKKFYMGLSFPVLKQNFMVLQSDGILKELCKSEYDKSKTTAKQVKNFALSSPPFEEEWQMFLERLGGLTMHQVLQKWMRENNPLLDRLVDPRPNAKNEVDPTTIRDMIAGDVDNVGNNLKGTKGNFAARYLRFYYSVNFPLFLKRMNMAVSKLVVDGIWGTRESAFMSAIKEKLSKISDIEKRKATWAAKTPEEKAANAAKSQATWAAMSPEKRAEVSAKIAASWAAMSPEEKAEIQAKMAAKWAAMSPEEKAEIQAKRLATIAAMSPEEREAYKAKIGAATKATWAAKTPEEREAWNAKNSAAAAAKWAAMSPEEREARGAKIAAGQAAMSPEEREARGAKISAAVKAGWAAKTPEERKAWKAKKSAEWAALSPEEKARREAKRQATWAAKRAKKRGDDEINEMGGKSRMRRTIRVRILKESASKDPLDTKFLSVQSISDYLTRQLGRRPTPNEILETYEKHLRALRDFGHDISEEQIAKRMGEAYKEIFLVKKAESTVDDED